MYSIGILALAMVAAVAAQATPSPVQKADGYRGIWYSNQPSNDEYVYKYSGGLGTYCADHIPLAVYSPEVNKTFFVYGGTKGLGEKKALREMVSYYDHKTGEVPRPTVVMEKGTDDAHHNSVLSMDKDGFLWVFAPSHGGKDGFIYKSRKPYSIDGFDLIMQREFSYPQPWYIDGYGFVFLFTKYTRGRESYVSTSKDGIHWSPDRKIAGFDGHYQVSWKHKNKVGTTFNWHPPVGGLNARTNLYYMESGDFGETWTNAAGERLEIPLSTVQNGALVHDYQKDGYLVYINDVNYDKDGRPVIFYVLSKGFESGPKNGSRTWMTAHWNGKSWDFSKVTTCDHNYDMGSIYIEDDGAWRIIGPSDPGPQAWCTGGEMVMWLSRNEGKTWVRVRTLTRNSERNHTYARRVVDGQLGFYSLWADGNALKPSESRIYFADKTGVVHELPETMQAEFAKPGILGK